MTTDTAAKVEAMPFEAILVHRATKPRDDMDKWHISLDGFETEYSKGIGLRKGRALPWGNLSIAEWDEFNRLSKPVAPTRAEVLDALACDAFSYLDTRELDDFAAEFGYIDKPGASVTKALEAWYACAKAAKFFQQRGLDPADFREE